MLARLFVDASEPDAGALGRAAANIRSGGVVAFPTDTLYGLAADPFSGEAAGRIFAIKGRPAERGLPLIAADAAQISIHLGALPPMGLLLAARFWPGPLTLLVAAPAGLAPEVTGGTGRVGVRVPAHLVARRLCELCERPLTATSANRSGGRASDDPDVVARALGPDGDMPGVSLLLDAGMTPGGAPSTIVDVTMTEPGLVRAGAISWEAVLACLRRG